jgi:hypothetical protein
MLEFLFIFYLGNYLLLEAEKIVVSGLNLVLAVVSSLVFLSLLVNYFFIFFNLFGLSLSLNVLKKSLNSWI